MTATSTIPDVGIALREGSAAVGEGPSIVVLHGDIPDKKLAELHRHVSATGWPSRELRAAFASLR
jgi:hypothetical protein